MTLYDSPQAYGKVSRLNHWLGALLVIGLLGVGLYFHEMPRGEERLYWLKLHVAVGALVLPLLAFRLGWRWTVRSPEPLAQPPLLQRATRGMHGLLLLAILVLIATGPLIVWSADRAIEVFSWFALPSPLGKLETLHEALEGVHKVTSRVLLVLIGLHILAALKHRVVDRDGSLRRMLG